MLLNIDKLVEVIRPGYECWVAATDFRYAYGEWPLRPRGELLEEADRYTLVYLRGIRTQLIEERYRPWAGMEFGKAILGRSIDAALREVEERVASRAGSNAGGLP
jgi:hypothetical protein